MIRLNCFLEIADSSLKQKAVETAVELVELSLHDKGCISYDLYQSKTNNDRYMIVETWASKEDLEAHKETEHFKRLVPELEKYSTLTMEVFEF